MRHPPVSARCPGEGPRRRLLLPLPPSRTRCVGGEAWLCGGSVSPARLAAARVPHPLPWPRPAHAHVCERGLSVCISPSPASHPSARAHQSRAGRGRRGELPRGTRARDGRCGWVGSREMWLYFSYTHGICALCIRGCVVPLLAWCTFRARPLPS